MPSIPLHHSRNSCSFPPPSLSSSFLQLSLTCALRTISIKITWELVKNSDSYNNNNNNNKRQKTKKKKNSDSWSFLVAQCVGDPVLSLLWCGFNPCPGNFCMLGVWPTIKNNNKEYLWAFHPLMLLSKQFCFSSLNAGLYYQSGNCCISPGHLMA